MPESSEASIPQPVQKSEGRWWNRIFKKPNESRAEVITAKEIQEPTLETEPVEELKVDALQEEEVPKIIEAVQENILSENPASVLQTETGNQPLPETSQRVLHPANKIFLHTSPSRNIGAIRRTGLMSTEGKDVIGRDLAYSVTFSSEFNEPYTGRVAIEKSPENNFILTIWKASEDIERIKDEKGKPRAGRFGLAKKLEPEETIPEGYLNSRSGGKWGRTVTRETMRKLDPSNFLAAIPIDQDIQDTLMRCKIEFAYDLADADSIEARLVEFLRNPARNLHLAQDYTFQALAHDLMARIEQEVLAYQTRAIAGDLLNRVQSPALQSVDKNIRDVEVGEILDKLEKVNDPVSYRYLKAWEKRLKQAYEKKGVEWPSGVIVTEEDRQAIISSLSLIDPIKLWGSNDGLRLAMRVADSIGMNLY